MYSINLIALFLLLSQSVSCTCIQDGTISDVPAFCADWESMCAVLCQRGQSAMECTPNDSNPFGLTLNCTCSSHDLTNTTLAALIPGTCYTPTATNLISKLPKSNGPTWGDVGLTRKTGCDPIVEDGTECHPAQDRPKCSGRSFVQCIPSTPTTGRWLNMECPADKACISTPGGFTCDQASKSACPVQEDLSQEMVHAREKRKLPLLLAMRGDARPGPARLYE